MRGFRAVFGLETGTAAFEGEVVTSQDGCLQLVAETRLDDREALTDRLSDKGFRLSAEASDAKLILSAWQAWGTDAPSHLLGDFAFALWDSETRTLFCARDAIGMKTLYYSKIGKIICVASEIQQVLREPEVSHEIDEVAVGRYLLNEFVEDDRTLFSAVRRLPSAHVLIARRSTFRLCQYWSLDKVATRRYSCDQEYVEEFLEIFTRAIADRVRDSEGCVGVSMSGGMDSTAVAAVAQNFLRDRHGIPVISFSMTFRDLEDCDESLLIEEMAQQVGLKIQYVDAEEYWPFKNFAESMVSIDSPLPLWPSSCEITRQCAKLGGRVLLTGHGGDNLLSGTIVQFADDVLRGRFVQALRGTMEHARTNDMSWLGVAYLGCMLPLLPEVVVRRLPRRFQSYRAPKEIPSWIRPDFLQRVGITEFPSWGEGHPKGFQANAVIRKSIESLEPTRRIVHVWDRESAPYDVSVRHPFLDRRLVEFAASVPPNILLRSGLRKWVLRQAMRASLPRAIHARRSKTSFASFVDMGMREKEKYSIQKVLAGGELATRGWVDGNHLIATAEHCLQNPEQSLTPLIPPITLEHWVRRHSEILVQERQAA